MAIANSPPCSTACSILAITFRWSGDQGRWNVKGKYASQKKRKSVAARAFRSGLTTAGSSPMSRPASDSAALRARARSFSDLVRIAVGFGPGRVADLDQPGDVAEQIDVLAVADAEARRERWRCNCRSLSTSPRA